MISMVCMVLMKGFVKGPASFHGYFGFIMCLLPFILDMIISLCGAYKSMSGDGEGATVEEIKNFNEENFLS